MRILAIVALATCVGLVSLPSEAQSGKALSQADVTKINEGIQTFAKAFRAEDWATLAELYTDDAVVCPPNEPSVKGRAAIRAWLEKTGSGSSRWTYSTRISRWQHRQNSLQDPPSYKGLTSHTLEWWPTA